MSYPQFLVDTSGDGLYWTGAYPRRATLDEVNALERKLWGGFSERALADLKRLRYSRFVERRVQARAAWALARHAYVYGRFEEALQHISFKLAADGKKRSSKRATLLEVELLCRLGMTLDGLSVIRDARAARSEDSDLILGHVNVLHHLAREWGKDLDHARLSLVNTIYISHGVAPITKLASAAPLRFDNLFARADTSADCPHTAKISVILPAYNAEKTVGVALRSLLSQSWQNLEFIVVDDCSVDATVEIVEEFAARDHRVKLVRHSKNQGAYGARNTGLEYAEGEFITVHDSDDWSHPEKLERQIAALLENRELVATVSHWVRVGPDFVFRGPSRPTGKYIEWNHSSLMVRREAFDKVGRWDQVRVAADTELIWRLQRIFGQESIKAVLPDVPLSLSLTQADSLTRSKETHVWTINYGLRREYRAASEYWHRHCKHVADLKLEQNGERAFPAPVHNLLDQPEIGDYEVLIVSDFSAGGCALKSAMGYIQAAKRHGMKTALFHWPSYERDVTLPVVDAIRGLAHRGEVRIVCPGEPVRASTVVICNPLSLDAVPDKPPHVEFEQLFVIVSRLPYRFLDGRDIQYDPIACQETLSRVFGTEGVWVPISKRVREVIVRDGRFPLIAPQDWAPMLPAERWLQFSAAAYAQRRRKHERPIIGRHLKDDFRKWPSKSAALTTAYFAEHEYEVRVLGGAAVAKEVVGYVPSNWKVLPYTDNDESVRTFLQDLDFFVCFPHERLMPEFGRGLLEAMAARVPVIASPVFEPIFERAAIYCEPQDVPMAVKELWEDPGRYEAQVRAGVDFVRRECDIQTFRSRLQNAAAWRTE